MKRWLSVFVAFAMIVVLFIPFSVPAETATNQNGKYVPGELIVKFKDDVVTTQSLHAQFNAIVKEKDSKLGFEVVHFDKKTSVEEMLNKYKENPLVEYVEPNYIVNVDYTPDDPYFSTYQYGPQKIQAPQAWDIAEGDGIEIAVVDTGVEADHPDLKGKVIEGYDFVDNDNVAQDGNGHGTHVAGIAAAITNNGVGVAGVAPNAKILPVRALNDSGSGTLADIASAIRYAADRDAEVINLSLGSTQHSATMQSAVNYAWNQGSVVVAAAGNTGDTTINYPAYYPNTIAVASTDSNDRKSSFSTYGASWVDVAAPGTSIYSTYIGGGYRSLNGTSMATPHVAGLAALLASQGKNKHDIRAAIEETADPIDGTGTYWRYGRVNAYKAVTH